MDNIYNNIKDKITGHQEQPIMVTEEVPGTEIPPVDTPEVTDPTVVTPVDAPPAEEVPSVEPEVNTPEVNTPDVEPSEVAGEPVEPTDPEDRSAYNCDVCKGEGLVDDKTICPSCGGTGKV